MTAMALKDGLAAGRDRDLERRVLNYLLERGVPALRSIRVEADNGRVILRGRVQSFYHKQLCLSCCRRVAGVVTLIDEVLVPPPAPSTPAAVFDWHCDRSGLPAETLASV